MGRGGEYPRSIEATLMIVKAAVPDGRQERDQEHLLRHCARSPTRPSARRSHRTDKAAAPRGELTPRTAHATSPAPGPWDASATRTARVGAPATSACPMTWVGPTRRDPLRPCRHPAPATPR